MIKVVNLHLFVPSPSDLVSYIGRPSPLGNKYSHMSLTGIIRTATREEAVALYKKWLYSHLHVDTVSKQLHWIYKAHLKGDVYLTCWCAPKLCHGDVIRELLTTDIDYFISNTALGRTEFVTEHKDKKNE